MDKMNQLKKMIMESSNIVFFGGAGTSTESGIPDFRSASGLYNIRDRHYPPEVMLSHGFLMNHTEDFYRFYKEKMIYKDARPNKAHTELADMEESGKLKAVITQNIDGLHQLAGSKNVLELHGSVHRNYCIGCGESYSLDYILDSPGTVPKCDKCGKMVRPDVVLYGENLDMEVLEKAVYYIAHADVLLVGGTSLVVQPAAGLIRYYAGNKLVLINKSATPYDEMAGLVIHDSVGKVLSEAFERD
jgi:NAD-dependent deacetylase